MGAHMATLALAKEGHEVESHVIAMRRKLEVILFSNSPGALVTDQFIAVHQKRLAKSLKRWRKEQRPEEKLKANRRRLKAKNKRWGKTAKILGGYNKNHDDMQLENMIVDLTGVEDTRAHSTKTKTQKKKQQK